MEVRFYLAIVVEGEGEVVVVFPVRILLLVRFCQGHFADLQ